VPRCVRLKHPVRCVSALLHSALPLTHACTERTKKHSTTPIFTKLCLKKVSTFKLFVTLSNLNRLPKFLHGWKAYEICYKTIHYPPQIRHAATIPWEIFITSDFVIHPQILIFLVFTIVTFSPY